MSNLKRILIADDNSESEDEIKRAKKSNKIEPFSFDSNTNLLNKQQAHINLIRTKHELELKELNKENSNLIDELNKRNNQINNLKLDLTHSQTEIKRLKYVIDDLKSADLLNPKVIQLTQENSKLKQDYEDLTTENLTNLKKLESIESENLNLKLDIRDLREKLDMFERAHAKHKQIITDYCNLKIEHKMQLIQLEEKYKFELEKIKLNTLN